MENLSQINEKGAFLTEGAFSYCPKDLTCPAFHAKLETSDHHNKKALKTMTDFVLPTTPGSIVSFDYIGPDGEGMEEYALAVTLVPAKYDTETKTLSGLVWTDSFGEEGGLGDVAPETILAGNPQLVFEAEPLTERSLKGIDIADERKPGAVLFLDLPGTEAVVTFVAGGIADDIAIECAWINALGEYYTQEQVNAYAELLLVEGSSEL